jgi:hypothetical protein
MHIQISLPQWCSAVQSFESISLSVVCALYHSIRLSASLSMQAAFRHTNQDVFLWRDHSRMLLLQIFCTTENTAPDPRSYVPACILRMFNRCLRTQVFMRPRQHCRVWFCIGRGWRHWSIEKTQKCIHRMQEDINCQQCLVILASVHCHLSSPCLSPHLFTLTASAVLHSHAYSYGWRAVKG